MKENKFIEIIKNTLSSPEYIGDDTAFVESRDLIATQDTLIEDVHFRISTISPYDLGVKSIAVNLSDIAASGGIPEFVLISLSLPPNIDENFVKAFYEGVENICCKYGVKVLGGDITGAKNICISVTAIGRAQGGHIGSRGSAKPGQLVVVSGEHGGSRAGLFLLENKIDVDSEIKNKFIKKHINPVPKIKTGRKIAQTCEQPAMMDTSDGLADALYKIADTSNVDIDVLADKIPYDKDLRGIADIAGVDVLKWVLFGAEDYELVSTMSEDEFKKLTDSGIKLYIIGKTTQTVNKPKVIVKDNSNQYEITQQALDSNGFDHFGGVK